MFTLITSRFFDKQLKKFVKSHPDLREKIIRVFKDLEKDPFQPSLKLHPLKGNLDGLFAISLTFSYRLTLILKIAPKEITLLDIGSHDGVYR
jgi:mRNA interferase YafQ